MLRRLFFLFPDEKHAQRVVDQLVCVNIPERRIHAIARGIKLETLPEATERQKKDTAFHIESFSWRAKLLVFSLAGLLFFVILLIAEWFWLICAFSVMVAAFVSGEPFVVHVHVFPSSEVFASLEMT